MRSLLLLLLLPLFGFGQIKFSQTKFDLGEINVNTPRYIDCRVENKGKSAHYILSVKTPPEVTYIHQGSLLQPADGITLRIQANPKTKGRFAYTILVYTSDKQTPTEIVIKGNVKSLPRKLDNNFTRCPAFGVKTPQTIAEETSFQLTVLVRDSITQEPLAKSELVLLQRGKPVVEDRTDKNGEHTSKVPLGYTYFYAAHPGYYTKEKGAYINFQRNYIIIDLVKAPTSIPEPLPEEIAEETVVVEEEIEEVEAPLETEEEEIEIVLEEEPQEETVVIVIEEEPKPTEEELVESPAEPEVVEEEVTPIPTEETPQIVELKDLDSNNFSEEYFLPTNVVFVIDVSSSMRSHEKLELMKYSLYQLTDMLRPTDKIALVSYSSDVEVLMSATSGMYKDSIKAMVESMEASGYTSGGEAIKIGYKEALKSYIPDGNNQVIIITDGAFNRNSNDYKRTIRRYKRKNIHLSVVGIKNSPRAKAEMEKASTIGQGTFIPINNLSDARHNLVQAIRRLSYRY
ncbi:VWA domain-containing protein [Lishizhenia sp.]|uniref:VWA domain-containing protein n=1 Tax=Lishizhenia sp. TaxID=2497594 RepID=UPI00299D5C7F|nr:VWA domain-containing protein [Lishizhenia sp.]MDX1446459.1 VWA domain-containing protein [Lishizhenia sp.]